MKKRVACKSYCMVGVCVMKSSNIFNEHEQGRIKQ